MPKTLSGDVAVRTATLLWSSVNSVGSFLTSQMGTFVFIWWVKRICSQSKNLAESQHKTEIGNNIHWKWILLWIFKYFYWLSDLKSYLSLFAGLSNPLLSWESSHSQVRGSQEFSLSLTMHAAGKLYTHAKPGFWKVRVPYPQNTHCKLFLPCKEHLLQNLGCDASFIKKREGGKGCRSHWCCEKGVRYNFSTSINNECSGRSKAELHFGTGPYHQWELSAVGGVEDFDFHQSCGVLFLIKMYHAPFCTISIDVGQRLLLTAKLGVSLYFFL